MSILSHKNQSKRPVLRLVTVTDGRICDELHQASAGSVNAGRGLSNDVALYDGTPTAKDYRRYAPLWLGLGIVLLAVGGVVFGTALTAYAAFEAQADTEALQQLANADAWSSGGQSALGLLLLLCGLVPTVLGLMGLASPAAVRDETTPGSRVPQHYPLFDYRDGVYYLDVPRQARGRVSLGKRVSTLARLRRMFGGRERLRVRLNPKARGKLVFGDTTLLFRFAAPAPRQRTSELPKSLRRRFGALSPEPLALACQLGSFLLLGGVFGYLSLFATPTEPEPAERFAQIYPVVEFEPDHEDPKEPPRPEPEPLVSTSVGPIEPRLTHPPEQLPIEFPEPPEHISKEAYDEAGRLGLALAIGTYNEKGIGGVIDRLQDHDNELGKLMKEGIVIADAPVDPLDPLGGKHLSKHAGLHGGGPITANDQPALEKKIKHERKLVLKPRPGEIIGEIDERIVQGTIRRRTSGLKACYERALFTDRTLEGKMTYAITISTVGRVTRVDVEHDSLDNATIRACTVAKIKNWRFPITRAEDPTDVTFSVVFSGA